MPDQPDLLSLSMQLNRQAFAQPPLEGWMTGFLALVCDRFASLAIRGVQVVQIIGDAAVQMASAGAVPSSEQYALDDASPIAKAIHSRRTVVSAPLARIYPILIGDDPLGVLIAYTDSTTGVISPDAAFLLDNLLGTLALQLGPAILHNLRTPGPQTGRLTRQIEMMRSLYEVTRTVSSALESNEVLNRAAQSLVETLKVDHVSTVIVDNKNQKGRIVAEYPDRGTLGGEMPLVPALYEPLERTQQPIFINNIEDADLTHPDLVDFLAKTGLSSVAYIPMLVQGQFLGVISLEMYYDAHEFTAEEIEGAVAITSQLSISVRNAQLYDEIKRRATQLERITDLSRRVTSTFDRNRIFKIIKEDTQTLINTDLISVSLYGRLENTLYLFILGDNEPAVTEFPFDKTALQFIINSATPVVLDDISGSEYPDYKLFSQSRMRAAAIVPLVVGGYTIGVYTVLHRQNGYYQAIDLAVLEQIGTQLAIALENARIYSEAARRAETERLLSQLSNSVQSPRVSSRMAGASGGQPQNDMQGLLLNTVQQIAEALGAKRARIRLQAPPSGPEGVDKTGAK